MAILRIESKQVILKLVILVNLEIKLLMYLFCYFSSIVTMIKHIEKMLTSYAVPVAFVNGDRFVLLHLTVKILDCNFSRLKSNI